MADVEDRRPLGNCEGCSQLTRLYDCPPEIAWPNQWLCAECMRTCERNAEAEEEQRLMEQEMAKDAALGYPEDPEVWK